MEAEVSSSEAGQTTHNVHIPFLAIHLLSATPVRQPSFLQKKQL